MDKWSKKKAMYWTLNLDAYRPVPQIYTIKFKLWSPQLHQHLCLHSTCNCYYKLFLQLFFAPAYIEMIADTNHSSTLNLCIAHIITHLRTQSKAFSKSTKRKYGFFPLAVNFSCICLTIKLASVVPLPFTNPKCIASISICCRILCFKILSTTFIACSNTKIHTPLDPLSLCKLAVPHLTSSPLGCNLLSQYHYINPISTEFQYPLWLASFLLLALTSLELGA